MNIMGSVLQFQLGLFWLRLHTMSLCGYVCLTREKSVNIIELYFENLLCVCLCVYANVSICTLQSLLNNILLTQSLVSHKDPFAPVLFYRLFLEAFFQKNMKLAFFSSQLSAL